MYTEHKKRLTAGMEIVLHINSNRRDIQYKYGP